MILFLIIAIARHMWGNVEIKKILLNADLNDKYIIIETAMHELLHTIDNEGFACHKGPWEKWANYISSVTCYRITQYNEPRPDCVLKYLTPVERKKYMADFIPFYSTNEKMKNMLYYLDSNDNYKIKKYIFDNLDNFSKTELVLFLNAHLTLEEKRPILQTLFNVYDDETDNDWLSGFMKWRVSEDRAFRKTLAKDILLGKYDSKIKNRRCIEFFTECFNSTSNYKKITSYFDEHFKDLTKKGKLNLDILSDLIKQDCLININLSDLEHITTGITVGDISTTINNPIDELLVNLTSDLVPTDCIIKIKSKNDLKLKELEQIINNIKSINPYMNILFAMGIDDNQDSLCTIKGVLFNN